MADYCAQCYHKHLDSSAKLGTSDLTGLCEPGRYVTVLCEGCGDTHVDHLGRCVMDTCLDEVCHTDYPGEKPEVQHRPNDPVSYFTEDRLVPARKALGNFLRDREPSIPSWDAYAAPGWYFYDETWSSACGPYPTRAAAHAACVDYTANL